MIFSIILLVSALIVSYVYVNKIYSYWEERQVPYEKPIFPFGNFARILHTHYTDIITQLYMKLKNDHLSFAGVYGSIWPMALVTGLDLLKCIFVTDFTHFYDHAHYYNEVADPLSASLISVGGERWRKMKTKVSSSFTTSKLKAMTPLFESKAINLRDAFMQVLGNRKSCSVKCKPLVARYSTDVIGAYALGIECNSLKNPNAEFYVNSMKFLESKSFSLSILLSTTFKKIAKILGVRLFPKSFSDFFYGVIKESVEFREKNNIEGKDLLEHLIKIRRKDDLSGKVNLDAEDGKISMHEIAAISIGFFLAGYETSANVTTYTLYELSQNQNLQDKVRKHIEEIMTKHGGKYTFEALSEMTYLDQCINETLRKHPPVGALTRVVTKDFQVPGTKHIFETGMYVIIPIHGIHNDPKIYPNPQQYDPDRFTPENCEKRDPNAFIPFGGGNRFCPGYKLAHVQMKMALMMLLRSFIFFPASNTPFKIPAGCATRSAPNRELIVEKI